MQPHSEQRSEEWFDARKDKITASNVGAILGLSVSKEQAAAIRKALEHADYPEEIFITKCQGGSVESIHANQFESVIKHIQQKGEEYAAAQRTAQ